jgi:hypothetical protein
MKHNETEKVLFHSMNSSSIEGAKPRRKWTSVLAKPEIFYFNTFEVLREENTETNEQNFEPEPEREDEVRVLNRKSRSTRTEKPLLTGAKPLDLMTF